ncbi:hypothetical protein EVAR_54148_1 [Eumeta japonica]|uniref:Uncharacterized protein n=1 Tax=Eumeta variegata TaxID=151549 RepID=A0A4C1Y0Z4_EUMVA|nr:hypothetical protein EVAR_54148_1 [Eumeta japonica]
MFPTAVPCRVLISLLLTTSVRLTPEVDHGPAFGSELGRLGPALSGSRSQNPIEPQTPLSCDIYVGLGKNARRYSDQLAGAVCRTLDYTSRCACLSFVLRLRKRLVHDESLQRRQCRHLRQSNSGAASRPPSQSFTSEKVKVVPRKRHLIRPCQGECSRGVGVTGRTRRTTAAARRGPRPRRAAYTAALVGPRRPDAAVRRAMYAERAEEQLREAPIGRERIQDTSSTFPFASDTPPLAGAASQTAGYISGT